MLIRADSSPSVLRTESLVPSSAVNPLKAETPRQPSPTTVQNPLRLYDGSKMVDVDRESLRILTSAKPDANLDAYGETEAERPGSRQFRRFEGTSADTLMKRTSVLDALKGHPDVYINPEGKVVVERDTEVYYNMLGTLRNLAEADTQSRAEKGHAGKAVKVGGVVGASCGATAGVAVLAAGAALGPVAWTALGLTAGAVAATAIYLNTKDGLGHHATEQRVKNLEKYGKIDNAANMSERIRHYFDKAAPRTIALCVTNSAIDTVDAYERIAGKQWNLDAPAAGQPNASKPIELNDKVT